VCAKSAACGCASAEGLAVGVHGNCGRPPTNRTAPAVREQILVLAGPGGKYQDLNVCHLQELLAEEEEIVIGRSTLEPPCSSRPGCARWPKRRPAGVHRRCRLRRAAEKALLLQMDSSPFAWLEARGRRQRRSWSAHRRCHRQGALSASSPSDGSDGYLWLLRKRSPSATGCRMSNLPRPHTILPLAEQPTLEGSWPAKRP